MSEMYVNIDVLYNEDDLSPFFAEKLFRCFEPLADSSIQSHEERVNQALKMLDDYDGGDAKSRLEVLSKIYDFYLMADKAEMVTPFQHKYSFTCGSSGMDFAREFCFMMIAFEPVDVKAEVTCDDFMEAGTDYVMELSLNTNTMWKEIKYSI